MEEAKQGTTIEGNNHRREQSQKEWAKQGTIIEWNEQSREQS
jgi:hypothetical protein